ncbi:MAG: hypothetical protein U0L51_08395 [Olegusella sp.]|nr:hypothetical protein [Olegusella sp.]
MARSGGVDVLPHGEPFGRGGLEPSVPDHAPTHPVWQSTPIATREKRYVEVLAVTDREGKVTPLRVVWHDGRRFDITDVTACDRAYSKAAHQFVTRYTIRIHDHPTYLFYEGPRWFVEAKVGGRIAGGLR